MVVHVCNLCTLRLRQEYYYEFLFGIYGETQVSIDYLKHPIICQFIAFLPSIILSIIYLASDPSTYCPAHLTTHSSIYLSMYLHQLSLYHLCYVYHLSHICLLFASTIIFLSFICPYLSSITYLSCLSSIYHLCVCPSLCQF